VGVEGMGWGCVGVWQCATKRRWGQCGAAGGRCGAAQRKNSVHIMREVAAVVLASLMACEKASLKAVLLSRRKEG